MDLENHVNELFHASIDTSMQSIEQLSGSISQCGLLLAQCLLSEHKILCCGEGQNAALSQLFSTNLLTRFNYERPSLPAINLSVDSTTLTAIVADNNANEVFAQQIRALGNSGDILFIVTNDSSQSAALPAIRAAHDREMIVISLSNLRSQDVGALLQAEDIQLCVPSDNRARSSEAQLFIINALSELIEQQLFGSF